MAIIVRVTNHKFSLDKNKWKNGSRIYEAYSVAVYLTHEMLGNERKTESEWESEREQQDQQDARTFRCGLPKFLIK